MFSGRTGALKTPETWAASGMAEAKPNKAASRILIG